MGHPINLSLRVQNSAKPTSTSKYQLKAQHTRVANTNPSCNQILVVSCEACETISIWTIEEEIFLKISPTLPIDDKEELIEFLKRNTNLFAWRPEDIPGITFDIILYELNMDHKKKPIQQQKMRFVREKNRHYQE